MEGVEPDSECFDAVLHSWAVSGQGDAPAQVEGLLSDMDRLYLAGCEPARPRTRSFNEALAAWSKSTESGAADRAEVILGHMERLANNGVDDVRPNLVSYTTVASLWAKTGSADGARSAQRVLRRMEERYREGGDESLKPDSVIYIICLDAVAKVPTKDSYICAKSILDSQIAAFRKGARRCKPNVYSYTLVLKTCASVNAGPKERNMAFDVAKQTFDELCRPNSGVAPNHVTYGTMLKACARLLPMNGELREMHAKDIFARACRDGFVGQMVLAWFRDAVSPDICKELMRDSIGDRLPKSWTQNVPADDEKRSISRRRRGNV